MSEHFDARVIFFNAQKRPSIRKITTEPILSISEWVSYIFLRDRQIDLPNEELFNNPKLYQYTGRRPLISIRNRYDWVVSAWVQRVQEMIASGWVPNVIWAHTGFPAGVVANRIKNIYGIPYVLTEHSPFSIDSYSRKLRPEIKKAFEDSDRVLSLGYDKVRQLALSDIEVEPHIIFNMVDEQLFKGLAQKYVPGQPLRLVTVGAASFYKDHKTLLRAIRAALDLGVPIHLTMIGLKIWGGDTLDAILRLIGELRLEKSVTIIDKLSRDEIAEILPNFHVFVLTSIQEGFPNAVLEALASGLFVVATRHGGTEDLLNPCVGRIVPVRNHHIIAEILSTIYSGEIVFAPEKIRNFVINECGREAYKNRVLIHLNHAMNKSNI